MIVWTESAQRGSAVITQRYGSGSSPSWYSTGGRNDGPCFAPSSAQVTPRYPVPSGSLFLAGARLCNGIVNTVFCPTYNNAPQVGLYGDGGTLSIRRGGLYGTTLATAVNAYDLNVRYISFKCLIDPAVGYTRVYIDGVLVAALSLDDIDTQPATGGLWNGFEIGGSGTYPKMCDLLVADGTDPSGAGHDLHEIWMDARVDYLPSNGNGYSSQLVGQDGNSVDNYLQVDETSPDDDTTYVQSANPAIDGYTKAACPVAGATILGAAVYARGRKTDAGVAVARVGLRSGSTNLMSDAQALPVNYADVYAHVGHDPADGAFTRSGFDGMQVVVEKA